MDEATSAEISPVADATSAVKRQQSGGCSERASMSEPARGQLVLVRHGETEWSRTGRHTGLTDVQLTDRGERLANSMAAALRERHFALVVTSPLERARRTAELAGLVAGGAGSSAETEYETDDELVEWDYGGYEGLTTPQIRERLGRPWTVFADGVVPGATPGETIGQVAARTREVLGRALARLADGDVALVGHGHCLRILAAVYLAQEPHFGAHLQLDAGSVSVLDQEHGIPTIRSWNRTAGPSHT